MTLRTVEKESEEKQIAGFLAKYTPEMVSAATDARARMRRVIPGGLEFVYDNYNALVFGYGSTDRPSEAVLSLAIMPRWVTLCFLKGARLKDPNKLLKGSGTTVRSLRLEPVSRFEDSDVRALVDQAISTAAPEFAATKAGPQTIIRSISAKQRPRRPSSSRKIRPRKSS